MVLFKRYVDVMEHVIHTKMGGGRRIAIPADVCHKYGLEPGTPVVLEPTDTGLVLRPLGAVMREVQRFFADVAPPDVLLSEELSRDRRKEAEREDRG
jgi:bifunctional DNA-binding transcriptional regulator/antitoxin component of YhaV-PrlF toxin-antitoxin module